MCRDSVSSVQTAVGESNVFPISVGVHLGSANSLFLFNVVLEVVTANFQDQPPWLMMYADDIALVAKTEYMSCGSTDSNTIPISSDLITRSDTFRYLESVLHEFGNVADDVQARIDAAWAKWREVTGVVCDRKMPPKLKG
ncbi:hypothetical protein PYW07_013927 [Mythimna separata]|uniref:Reverse transcriptase domain-containing protein n=1 Tax=Mythimna separata TaxID=271217 RepID=A0AAD7YGE9_MYTSE|nr:hypothetical protein PYW07_013927 [Mythimna separata]